LQNSLGPIAERLLVLPGVAVGASLAVSIRTEGGWRSKVGAFGRPALDEHTPVTPQTVFDLASVTKPFFAAALVRSLDLRTPLGALLDETRGSPLAATPLELLLAHRSGLEPHRSLFAPLVFRRPFRRGSALRIASTARPDSSPPEGFPAVYSDLGYVLLGEALSRSVGMPLDEVIEKEVLGPLGIEDIGSARQWLERDPEFVARTAATEIVTWRGGVLRGVVHDENAWALCGHGACGHAGLFGTAAAVARFGSAIVDAMRGDRTWLDEQAIRTLTRPRPGGTLRAGFDGVSPVGSAAGDKKSPETVGHLGFTGTSLWCDPGRGIVTVALTNRVHPTRDDLGIRAARPRVQNALYEQGEGLGE
jgi:serine-type D-Ala-D-Ala carboxypeptidase